MARRISVSVVIPAYNEARRLGATIVTVVHYLRGQPWDWEVRIVDDGSVDETATIAESHAAQDPHVVVQREQHRGKGGAVKAGLVAARGSFRFICDADLSMPIDSLARFLPPAAPSFDIAIGTREGAAAKRVGEPFHRHVMGRLFNRLVQWVALPGIEDSQCGFKMFTDAAVDLVFPHVTVDGWAFDVEVLAIARAQGLRIVEVPIEWHYRQESKLSMLRDGWAMMRQLLRIRARAAEGVYNRRR